MGTYLNTGSDGFRESISSQIYVDKMGLLGKTNEVIGTRQKFICISRPRRFGKSMDAEMLAVYYGKGDSKELFSGFEIEKEVSFSTHLNRYNVILLNMQEFLSTTYDVVKMIELVEKSVLWELLDEYPDLRYFDSTNLIRTLQDIYSKTRARFVFVIDEWDCIFRENKDKKEAQELYLDFSKKEVFIPNYEINREYVNAIRSAGWDEVIHSVKASERLLEAIISGVTYRKRICGHGLYTLEKV